MVALLALLVLAGTALAQQWTEYNITFDDSSPMLQFTPTPPVNVSAPSAGWAFNYSQAPTTDMISLGTPSHTTTRLGSSVSLRFTGTGGYFIVSGPGVVTINTNGQQATPQNIAANTTRIGIGGMSYEDHTVTLSLNSGQVSVTGAIVTTIVGGPGTTVTNITVPGLGEGNQVSKGIKVSDPAWWGPHPLMCNMDGTHCVLDHSITTATPQSTLQLSPPDNTVIMMVYGGTGPTNGNFIANISPNPIHGASTQTYSPSGPLLNMYSLLWFVALDPKENYNATFTYLGGTGMEMFDFFSVTYLVSHSKTTVPGGLPSDHKAGGGSPNGDNSQGKSSNIGPIVGGAVGGAGLLAIIAGLALWLWRRKKQRDSDKWQSEGVTPMNLVDDTVHAGSMHHSAIDPHRDSFSAPRIDFDASPSSIHGSTHRTVTSYPTDTVYSDPSVDPATRPLIQPLGSFGAVSSYPVPGSSSGSRVTEVVSAARPESTISGRSTDLKVAQGPSTPSHAEEEVGLPSYNEAIVSPVHRPPAVHMEQRMSSAASTHSAHSAREMDIIGYRLALLERRLEESGRARPEGGIAVPARPEPIAETPEGVAEARAPRPLPTPHTAP
ncbi:hypothetical protein Q8F55_001566 [Vanrija albida]|uniref:Transmembrane protein n=1 Tax=Vanrija albida TaxID=181172 RepID=A0ABR3QGF6_9TREE